MRRKPKVEKVRINLSIPKDILEEAEYYIENFSAYFTACLKNKIDYMHQLEQGNERNNITQNKRNYGDIPQKKLHSPTPQEEIDEALYQEKLALFLENRKRYMPE